MDVLCVTAVGPSYPTAGPQAPPAFVPAPPQPANAPQAYGGSLLFCLLIFGILFDSILCVTGLEFV